VNLVAQQQLGQPMPRAHQIAAPVLTRTHQVTQRLLRDAGHCDRMQLTGSHSRTSRSASRRSVLTRSLGPRGINPGAQATHSTPTACSLRANKPGQARLIRRPDRRRRVAATLERDSGELRVRRLAPGSNEV
jgi:hypothetical protein